MTMPSGLTNRGPARPVGAGRHGRRLLPNAILLLVGSAGAALALAFCATGGGDITLDLPGQPGNGTGLGAVASDSILLTGTIGAGLYPGGSRPVTFTVTNTGTSAVMVGAVSLVTVSAGAGCAVADFSMPDVAQDVVVPAGAPATALPNTGTLSMADTAANQDACKGATLTLALSSTGSSTERPQRP